jgi:hypothetical protein
MTVNRAYLFCLFLALPIASAAANSCELTESSLGVSGFDGSKLLGTYYFEVKGQWVTWKVTNGKGLFRFERLHEIEYLEEGARLRVRVKLQGDNRPPKFHHTEIRGVHPECWDKVLRFANCISKMYRLLT